MLRRPFSRRLIFDCDTSSRSATSSAVMPLSSRSLRNSWPSRRRLTVGLTLDATGRAPPAACLVLVLGTSRSRYCSVLALPLCVSAVEQIATKRSAAAGKRSIFDEYTPVHGAGGGLRGRTAARGHAERGGESPCLLSAPLGQRLP